MPRRPIQHVIDEMAESIFRDQLPASWPRNPFVTDYAKDFCVEIFENEEATGELFIVQLKGKKRLKPRRDGKYTCRLEGDHLKYYHFQLGLPVFLVLVDTSTREAFYSFVQGELSWIAGRNPSTKSGNIEVDPIHKLKDAAQLTASVRDAWKYMRDKFPGSVEAAAAFRRAKLKRLDPRFNYEVRHKDGHTNVTINPVGKPVGIKVHLHGNEDAIKKAWTKFLDFAEPLEASDDLQISVTGSPIFAEHGGILKRLEQIPKIPGQLTITAVAGEQSVALPPSPSLMVVAKKRCRISWRQPDCPLSFDLVTDINDQSVELPAKCNVHCKWESKVWRGKPLVMIPWLDSLHSFLTVASRPGSLLQFDISVYGNTVMSFSSGSEATPKLLADCIKNTEFLIKARRIDALLGTRLTIPKRWTKGHFRDMHELDVLFSTGRFAEAKTFSVNFSLIFHPGQPEPDWKANASFGITPPRVRYTIWGKKFWMPGARLEFSDWESITVKHDRKNHQKCQVSLVKARRTFVWTECPWPMQKSKGSGPAEKR